MLINGLRNPIEFSLSLHCVFFIGLVCIMPAHENMYTHTMVSHYSSNFTGGGNMASYTEMCHQRLGNRTQLASKHGCNQMQFSNFKQQSCMSKENDSACLIGLKDDYNVLQ